MQYRIEFAGSVKGQIKGLTARQRNIIFDSIEKRLTHEPLVETRNRKPLLPNPVAPWELRIGSLRVYYEVASNKPEVVRILAVGQKKGNRILVGNQEIEL